MLSRKVVEVEWRNQLLNKIKKIINLEFARYFVASLFAKYKHEDEEKKTTNFYERKNDEKNIETMQR